MEKYIKPSPRSWSFGWWVHPSSLWVLSGVCEVVWWDGLVELVYSIGYSSSVSCSRSSG